MDLVDSINIKKIYFTVEYTFWFGINALPSQLLRSIQFKFWSNVDLDSIYFCDGVWFVQVWETTKYHSHTEGSDDRRK